MFLELLAPLQSAIGTIMELRDRHRADKDAFAMLSAVSEGIPALGWLTVSPKPAPFIGDLKEAGQFYANRVIKDNKERYAHDHEGVHPTLTRVCVCVLMDMCLY